MKIVVSVQRGRWMAAVLLVLFSTIAWSNPRVATPLVIRSHDGFELAGRFRDAGKRSGAVLMLHQCDREGEATGLEGLARSLANRGFHALEVDLRGYGASVSDAFDGENWREAQEHFDRDIAAAHRALVSRPEVDDSRIALLGASCGGRFAVNLGRAVAIRGIVLLSVGLGNSPAELLGGVKGLPLLCIASEDDPYGRAAESMRIAFETSEDPASGLLLLKGDAHGAPLLAQEPWLSPAILDWLAARLNG